MKKILPILTHLLTFALGSACALALITFTSSGTTKLDQLEALILERFIGETDPVVMEDAAADAMVNALGDRWSYYIPASEYSSYLERTENAYVGVGITIVHQDEPAGLLIVTVQDGGGAQEAGLLPGDVIIAIEETDARELTAQEAKEIVRGEEGTNVLFQLLRDGKVLTFSVQRRHLLSPVAAGEMLENNIGLITISNFDARCAAETLQAIDTLIDEGAQALIFDVRFNPGGYANELVKILDYLLPEGDLFRTVDYRGNEHLDRSDAAFLDIPIAVICNQDSYSAAEFFAAAIQEYHAGIIVGTQTCGKGYFQNTFTLSDGSAVGLSVGKYFTPKGNSLIGIGIVPDILVEPDEETAEKLYYGLLRPEEDPQIQAAVNALIQ